MSLLGEFETEIDDLWLAHENKYEVLNDFLPFHCRMLQSLGADESLHRGAESYVLGREKFRKDLVALHVNLQCNADLQKVVRKKRSLPSPASDPTAAVVNLLSHAHDPLSPLMASSAEQLAANVCAIAAVSLKRQLEQPTEARSRLVDDLAMWRENMRRRGPPALDASSAPLPLASASNAEFGAQEPFSSTSSSSSSSSGYAKNYPFPVQQAQSQDPTDTTRGPTPEALVKYRLVCKLQRCAKAACDIVKLIGDEQMPRALAGATAGGR